MTVLGVLGSKGGSGASLVATNLAVSLTSEGKTLLIDLHQGLAYDDLLLNLSPQRSWMELIPVADELTERHLDLAFVTHPSGLKMLAGPEELGEVVKSEVLGSLLKGLVNRFDWVVLDLPPGQSALVDQVFPLIGLLLLVSTGDLPAIRNSKRILAELPENLRGRSYLIMNQIGRRHPVEPPRVAKALGLPLISALPPDPRAVGYQVSYGSPSIHDSRSGFGRGINELTQRVIGILAGLEGSEIGEMIDESVDPQPQAERAESDG